MEVKERETSHPKGVNLAKVSLGQWQLFLLEEPDFRINDQPFIALTMMYHSETHEYIWRALGRHVESGRVKGFQEFLIKCHQLFNSGTPCLGMKPPDAQFPLSCEFSKNCSIMIPKSAKSQTCQACSDSSEDVFQFWQDIQDVTVDIIFNNGVNTLKALRQKKNPEQVWVCPMCPEHVSWAEMKSHLEKSHYMSRFYCLHCSDRFVDAKDLCFHTLQEHPEINEVFCPLCPIRIPLNEEFDSLLIHFRTCLLSKNLAVEQEEHAQKLNVCPFCYKPFRQKSFLGSHMLTCMGVIPLQKIVQEDPLGKFQTSVDSAVDSTVTLNASKNTTKTSVNTTETFVNVKETCLGVLPSQRFVQEDPLRTVQTSVDSSEDSNVTLNTIKTSLSTTESLVNARKTSLGVIPLQRIVQEDPLGKIQTSVDSNVSLNTSKNTTKTFVNGSKASSHTTTVFVNIEKTSVNNFSFSSETPKQSVDSPTSKMFVAGVQSPEITEKDEPLEEDPLLNHPPIKDPLNTGQKSPAQKNKVVCTLDTRTCPKCFKTVSPLAWSHHRLFYHDIGDFSCDACSSIFETAKELKNHATKTHPDKEFLVCPNCYERFRIQEFDDHIKTCQTIIFMTDMNGQRVPFTGILCIHCGHTFHQNDEFLTHKNKQCLSAKKMDRKLPQSQRIEISTVSQKLSTPSASQQIVISSTLHQCGRCFRLCKTKDDLVAHIQAKCEMNLVRTTSKPSWSKVETPSLLLDMEEFLSNSMDIGLESPDCDEMDESSKDNDEVEEVEEVEVVKTIKDEPLVEPIVEEPLQVEPTTPPELENPERETPKEEVPSKFDCEICFRRLPLTIMHKHKMFRHKLGHFICPNCPLRFEKAEQVSKHIIAHPGVSNLQCPNCKEMIGLGPNLKGLEIHIQTCHKLKFRWDETTQQRIQYIGRVCMDCGRGFQTVEQLVKHEELDTCIAKEDNSWLRQEYVEALKVQKKRIEESKSMGGPKVWKCETCDQLFPNAYRLRRHKISHNPPKPSLCFHCGKEFSQESNLQKHILRIHKASDEYKCENCEYTTGSQSVLNDHQKIHEPPNHLCNTCGKRFARIDRLKLHTRTHTGEKPYMCDLCDYRSAARSNLNNHIKFVHNRKPRPIRSRPKKS